jgi:hypothetical protein
MVTTEESRALVPLEGAPIDLGIQAVVNVGQALARLKELQEFVRAVMVKDEDYGIIPGTRKPTLLKPGAEKLCEIYGLVPNFYRVEAERDWEAGFFYVEIRCTLTSKRTQAVVAEGVGSCNSKERRYANQDVYSIANTVLKMAKKRALVDATLSATRSSGLFTQDLEDMEPEQQPRPAAAPVPPPEGPTANSATQAQVRTIYAIGKGQNGLDEAGVEDISVSLFGAKPGHLSKADASALITRLKAGTG